MVLLTCILSYTTKQIKRPLKKYLRSGFLDKLRLQIKAGTGGSGLEKYGGVGGKGGDIFVKSKDNVSLLELSKYVKNKKLTAGTGYDSSKRGILGECGEDLIIHVPTGVIVYNENGSLIGEINKPEEKLVVALGGVGGCKETNYTGQRGENHVIILDFKLISDVILVGFPNAGKSTLIRCLSKAKPKVASYAFTTLKPYLGIIQYKDYRKISITDLPGLIEGAHKNYGMGHNFLKHLERSKLLVFVLDIQGFQLNTYYKQRNCLETILLLNKEIELYNPDLLKIPAIIVLNKMDTDNAQTILNEIKPKLENLEYLKSEFPKEICPKKFLYFQDILSVALINKDEKEIKMLKKTIRENVDKLEEVEDKNTQKEMPELKLIKRLKRELKITTHHLI